MRWTRLGLIARGTMQNANMAAALGVNPPRVYAITFGIGAALSGLAGAVLAPAIVISGLILAPTIYRAAWAGAHAAHPELAANAVPDQLRFLGNIALEQIRALVLFPLPVALGMRARRHDPGLHKRLLILATIAPIGAAIVRIDGLPSAMPGNPIGMDLFPALLLAAIPLGSLPPPRHPSRLLDLAGADAAPAGCQPIALGHTLVAGDGSSADGCDLSRRPGRHRLFNWSGALAVLSRRDEAAVRASAASPIHNRPFSGA